MKKITVYLFYLSVFFMTCSYVIASKGYSEIYPFFAWKLFSKPYASATEDEIYKLYGVKGIDTVRIIYKETEVYDGNTQFGIVNAFGKNVADKIDEKQNIDKLKTFAKIVAPEYSHYILAIEKSNPQKIGQKDFKIEKKIITTF